MSRILVAGVDGLRSFVDGTAGPTHLAGRSVTAVVADGGDLWAVVDGREIWGRAGGGETWSHAADLDGHTAQCIAFTDALLVGTSEARLFRLAGGAVEPVEGFDRAEGRSGWYTPWGGPPDTRSMSEWSPSVYVNVHVGGILRTDDGGAAWTPTIEVDADVHQVATADGLVLAACARGLASSDDRGATWRLRRDGLRAPYCRAVAVSGDAVLVTASSGPGGSGSAVYRGDLRGDGRFERCRDGLPEAFDDNVDTYCLDALPDGSFAAIGTSDGRVFASTNGGATWEGVASGLPAARRVLVLP